MYHYDPNTALEELLEDALLPNPVHIRDMIIRSRLSPDAALALNRRFQAYMDQFNAARGLANEILVELGKAERKA